MAVAKLQTTVTNPTAAERFYGYLGTHGIRIAASGSKTYDGDIRSQMSVRERVALDRDLTNSKITLKLDMLTNTDVGAPNGTGVTVREEGDGAVHKTVLTLTAVAIPLVDEAGVGLGVEVDQPASDQIVARRLGH